LLRIEDDRDRGHRLAEPQRLTIIQAHAAHNHRLAELWLDREGDGYLPAVAGISWARILDMPGRVGAVEPGDPQWRGADSSREGRGQRAWRRGGRRAGGRRWPKRGRRSLGEGWGRIGDPRWRRSWGRARNRRCRGMAVSEWCAGAAQATENAAKSA